MSAVLAPPTLTMSAVLALLTVLAPPILTMSAVLALFPLLVLQFLSHLVSLLREVVTGRNSWRLGGGRGGGSLFQCKNYTDLNSFPAHNVSCHTFSHLV